MIYVKELIAPKELKEGSEVVFVLNTGEKLEYRVVPWFLNYIEPFHNDKIFEVLGIRNKNKFVEDIVGYRVCGVFPDVRNAGDLWKVITALADYNKPKYKKTIDSIKENNKEEKFTLAVKKHKQTKLNFNL